jgi:hypothetical protein
MQNKALSDKIIDLKKDLENERKVNKSEVARLKKQLSDEKDKYESVFKDANVREKELEIK